MENTIKHIFNNESLIQDTAKHAKKWREFLHAKPELSGMEVNTANYITNILQNIGVDNVIKYSNLGLSAFIGNPNAKIKIGIRAEMDALPLDESNKVNYKSCVPGVMHACGHDFHMSLLLAVAQLLKPIEKDLNFGLKLIFQPSEETLPGGASVMINEGVLENPKLDFMLGAHVLPELEVGKFGFKSAQYMASGDEIFIEIIGKGGHAAMPEKLNDPVVAAAQLILALQQIVSRNASPQIPAVLSFGRFIANGRTNVIPDIVEIEGTFRTFDENQRFRLHQSMQQICNGISASYGVKCILKIVNGYPSVYNNDKLSEQIISSFELNFNPEQIVKLPIRMTTDDFAFYSQKIPSCYFRIGVGEINSQNVRQLHTSSFDISSDSYVFGIKALLSALMSF